MEDKSYEKFILELNNLKCGIAYKVDAKNGWFDSRDLKARVYYLLGYLEMEYPDFTSQLETILLYGNHEEFGER